MRSVIVLILGMWLLLAAVLRMSGPSTNKSALWEAFYVVLMFTVTAVVLRWLIL